MKSIKTKIINSFLALILLSSIIIGLTAVVNSGNALKKAAEQSLSSLALEDSKLTASRVLVQKRTIEMLALNKDLQSMNWAEQQPVLQGLVKETDFLDIAVVDLAGSAHYS